MRRGVAEAGVALVVLGDDGGDRGDGDDSLVSCSSGGRRSSSGTTVSGLPGRREDVRETRNEQRVRVV